MWLPFLRRTALSMGLGGLILVGCGGETAVPGGPARLVEPVDPVLPSDLPPIHAGLLDVSDAYRDAEGWWIVDRRQAKVHRLDADLHPRFQFGGRGDAPGEMLRPSSLARFADTLVVLDEQDVPVLHLFLLDGTFLRREAIRAEGCTTLLGTGLIARPGRTPLLLATCGRVLPRPAVGSVVVDYENGGVGRVVAGSLAPMRPGSMRPESAIGLLRGDALWAGTSSDPCLLPIDVAGAHPAHDLAPICMEPWVGVRFNVRQAMAETMNRPVPDIFDDVGWLPAADRVFPHPDGVIFRRLRGIHARELLLVDERGSMHTLADHLPEAAWVWGDEILIAWTGIEGMHLERRPLRVPPGAAARDALP